MSTHRAWRRAVAAVLSAAWAVCFVSPPAAADDADDLINTIVRQTRTRTDAARKLLAAAAALGDAPAVQTRLCEKACELGLTGLTGYPTVLAALDMLEKIAPQKIETWQDKRLDVYSQQYYRSDRQNKATNGQEFVRALLIRAEQHKGAADWQGAARCLRQATGVARTLNLPKQKAIFEKMLAADHLVAVHARLAGLKAYLVKKPDDAAARRQLVMMYVVDLDMLAEAARYVGQGLDPTLAGNVTLAAKEASELTDDDFVTLGQWFKTLAAGAALKDAKIRLLTRARDNLRMYLEVYTRQDVKRLAATTALKGVDADLKALSGAAVPVPAPWVDLLAMIDPMRDKVRGDWSRQGGELTGSYKSYALITAPVFAVGSYDLHLVFTLVSGTEQTVVLPAGAGSVAMIFGGYRGAVSGLSNINGEDASSRSNPTGINLGRGGSTLRTGAKIVLDAAVRIKDDQAHITARLDDKQLVDWTGPQASLQVSKYYLLPARTFGLGTCASKMTWHTGKVRLLDPDDRNIKWVSRDATFRLSSAAQQYPPLKAFLTGVGQLNNGCAIHTDTEAAPAVVVTLKQAADVKRIVIANRQGKYSRYTTGLTVWASENGTEWKELWQAKSLRSEWLIHLKTPVKARYVKIGLVSPKSAYLALAGVKIYAATEAPQ